MKSLITSALLLVSLALAGCINPTSARFADSEKAKSPAAVRMLTSAGASFGLANNPRFVPVGHAIVAAIDTLGEGAGENILTEELITKFVAKICVQNGMTQQEAVIYTSLARNVYIAYVEDFRPTIVITNDPNVKLYITAFKNGLVDALAVIEATTAT